jgi:hypothetical protein
MIVVNWSQPRPRTRGVEMEPSCVVDDGCSSGEALRGASQASSLSSDAETGHIVSRKAVASLISILIALLLYSVCLPAASLWPVALRVRQWKLETKEFLAETSGSPEFVKTRFDASILLVLLLKYQRNHLLSNRNRTSTDLTEYSPRDDANS